MFPFFTTPLIDPTENKRKIIVGGIHDIAIVRGPHHGSHPLSFDTFVSLVLFRVGMVKLTGHWSIRPPLIQSEPISNVYRPTLTQTLWSDIFNLYCFMQILYPSSWLSWSILIWLFSKKTFVDTQTSSSVIDSYSRLFICALLFARVDIFSGVLVSLNFFPGAIRKSLGCVLFTTSCDLYSLNITFKMSYGQLNCRYSMLSKKVPVSELFWFSSKHKLFWELCFERYPTK